MKIHLLRHAKAERRIDWDAPDALRPLAPRGLRQAAELVDSLAGAGLQRLISSPHLRCVQSVEPLAAATGLRIELDERLAEGERAAKALSLLEELGDTPALCCSHGDVIPELLSDLEDRGVALEPEGRFRCEKASIWLVEGKRGKAREARYVPAPRAERDEAGDGDESESSG